jgi:hypothetical protein
VTSAEASSLARCKFCGREFDNRRFQVFVEGTRGAFHSADCALRAASGEIPPDRERPEDRVPRSAAALR